MNGRPFPGTDLMVYRKEIDQDTGRRFDKVIHDVHNLLEAEKPIWNQGNPLESDIATNMHFLGRTGANAPPYLVVLCSPDLRTRVRKILRKKRVRKLYEQHGLKMKIVDNPPKPTSAVLDIDVCLNNASTNNPITFCGTPIILVDKYHGRSGVSPRKATIGGVIEVTFEDGRSTQYGVTAGHAVEELL